MVDQALASGSNIATTFAAARASGVEEFGQITLALTATVALLAICRGVLGSPLTLLAHDTARLREDARYALTAACCLGGVLGVIGGALALGYRAFPVVLFILAVTPLILVQDVCRYFAVSQDDTKLALRADGGIFFVSITLFVVTLVAPRALPPEAVFMGWGAAALAGSLYILASTKMRPRGAGFLVWVRKWEGSRIRFGAEASFGAFASLVQASLITILLGAQATAALRGSATLLGPLSLLINSLPLAVVPELRRQEGGGSSRSLWQRLTPLAWLMAFSAAIVGVASVVAPDRWGVFLLGASWTVIQPLVWLTAIEYVGQSWLAIGNTVLRAQARTKELLSLRLLLSGGGVLSALLVTAITQDVRAVAIALAFVAVLAALASARRCLAHGNEARLPLTRRSL